MTDRVRLDLQDKAALRALDSDFMIDPSEEVATSVGDIEIVRVAGDRFQFTVTFSGGEKFLISLSRSRTLEQLGVRAES
jgi:DNA repair exonuclease SbcCD ATPase subunit